ncbi:hypothetical protein I4U23_016277 [Adineta vaga]|nr:hypothetical protein I4U23_016277 [Adineta vaga]
MATSAEDKSQHRKLALIIANGNYSRAENRLNQSQTNAKALNDLLNTIGFNVTLIYDVEKHDMTKNIIDFSQEIRDNDLVLFYFSGHIYQTNGKNYLIPVGDAYITKDQDVEDFANDCGRIFNRLIEKNSSYVTLCILDCCQEYLIKNNLTANSTSTVKGLREISPINGAFIQFACAANETSHDNLFTKHLLKNIAQENINIVNVFQRISDDVYKESDKGQRPLSINGLGQHGEIYLNQVYRPPPPPPPVEPTLSTEQFFSKETLSNEEKAYYEDCKEYYRMTKQPLISVSEEIFNRHVELPSVSLKFGVDENCKQFNLKSFIHQICAKFKLTMKDLLVKKIQEGSAILEVDIFDKFETPDKKLKLKMIYNTMVNNEELQKELGRMKIFLMYMGPIQELTKKQKYRAEITLNPEFNRKYGPGQNFWIGEIKDGKNRGGRPYYCPVGWQRISFYVTDNFDAKFNGWCIGYHGTKFAYGLSILLSGLKPADRAEHGAGVYISPSINYASHPRYSEVKPLDSSHENKFSKHGKYIQYVLECRIHPSKIKVTAAQTLRADNTIIDSNIDNSRIEWLIDNQNESIVDFNDSDSPIVCTGILMRVTDNHPGLLPESQWWYKAHICENSNCCLLGINLAYLNQQRTNGVTCNIVFD